MSRQLSEYFQLRADGVPVEQAAEQSSIGMTEAHLWEADIEAGEVELPLARAPAPARVREDETGETDMEDVKTSIRVGDGPEVPIDLGKSLDDPANADAKEQMTGMFKKPATDTGQRLKLFIERAERLDAEIADFNADKSDLFKEMKSEGFDTKTIKRIIKLRKMDAHERQEAEQLLSTYMDAIGMTPIEAAIAVAA